MIKYKYTILGLLNISLKMNISLLGNTIQSLSCILQLFIHPTSVGKNQQTVLLSFFRQISAILDLIEFWVSNQV